MENPYKEAAEFKVSLVESVSKNGLVVNPFNPNATESLAEKAWLKQASKASLEKDTKESKSVWKVWLFIDNSLKGHVLKVSDEEKLILSAFHLKKESLSLAPHQKVKVAVTYLPLQLIKHSAVLIFSNEKVGDLVYYLEGSAGTPDASKVRVEESSLDPTKIKLIKSNRKFYTFFLIDYLKSKLTQI